MPWKLRIQVEILISYRIYLLKLVSTSLILITMHFGKIVKDYIHSQGLSAEELSVIMEATVSEILHLFEKKAWTLDAICAVSIALDHDFLQYLERTHIYSNR